MRPRVALVYVRLTRIADVPLLSCKKRKREIERAILVLSLGLWEIEVIENREILKLIQTLSN